MVSASDVKFYFSTNSLGGAITGSQCKSANPNNLFINVPADELSGGVDYYKCIYIKNTHATEKIDDVTFWLTSNNPKSECEIKWGKDPNINPAQTIPDKYTEPDNVSWRSAGDMPSQDTFGTLNPGEAEAIWIWLHVPQNAAAVVDDDAVFLFQFKLPPGSTGTPGGGDTDGTGGNPPPPSTNWKMAIAGDWGCETETNDVINLIKSQGYDHILGVGDNAYESPDCWISRFSSLKSKMESAFGNHEYEESGGIGPYKTFFGYSKTYFTYTFQNVQIFVIDTNINCDSGSAQHNFISDALHKSLSDNTIYWRIACFHHPMYGASSQHSYNTAGTRQNFHQEFITNKVNFVVTGHNHNWQRTHQIAYSGSSTPTIVDSSSPYSRTAAGFIHVVSGTGGHDSAGSLYSLGSQPPFQAYQNRSHNGVWEIIASNQGTTLTCRFRNIDNGVSDTFTIS